ncbi:4-hydroxybenzoate 3-monooxygenase [Arthrobacter sp. TES]|uniref:4-hydroxybenzoate 3-monooxygenase n=1 Tax=Paenarthrobacter ureafaciens TaxID=37931 RepID=A0AAX3EH67_PAEUR|nr:MULTISPECIES: 4-hydroxybenzoate 3-monooxygenase [Paenarthrobacter]AOY73645.1 4-hydroxybenzoate 3-monooxygenase [Arthrobacter sp. ZXY-2]ERI37045.1 4-hydroxybenzoate 3-monooxygenase [Arthrobacter sp. AK-YN10]NKR12854.1 4-hydroxybenzoate 3-monooxygenase [Arthrobacter sp. M5]NKR16074.1 4-hydroxybenzoate 3-monooxygenase [Arthrobacter sp. M6]OEH58963.1 4-hydroxybenzoate 3-monooxygenase [Arthrobacter sp. D4]OEH59200.1 4-hydroxybenzoate 3-monooxygenase [Arthrobacter sp. D2]QOI65159.1 4-hydroxyben
MARTTITTQVAIMGAGPAGLMLSHLLAKQGIESVVVEIRSRKDIEETVRAGILEHGTVNLLVDSGVSDRVLREGDRHDGIELRLNGESHRINFKELVGESVWLYPQTDVFMDLAARREADGGDVRYSVTDTSVSDLEGRPKVWFTDSEGQEFEIQADFLVGADGSRSHCRFQIPEANRKWFFHEYPFAWFGILAEAARSSDELIYANSEHGFALISQRTETVQRMYFQCDPKENVADWDDERIWSEFRKRVNGNGFELKEGPVLDKMVLPFRSFVHTPMRYGNLFLAGDAAHTVPPTGAKGLNLAINDVKVLFEGLDSFYSKGSSVLLDSYSDRALDRVWKAQHFSYWMTSMLHTVPGADDFDRARQLGELRSVVSSEHGKAYLAESYTGWPEVR